MAQSTIQAGPKNPAGSAADPKIRTLLLKDTAVGDDIADAVPIYAAGSSVRMIGVLRKALTADLEVRVRYKPNGGTIATLGTITIPSSTAVYDSVVTTASAGTAQPDRAVLIFDVLASDGQVDPNGVASITVHWE